MMISRRSFLAGGTALALAGGVSGTARKAFSADETPLKVRAARKGLRMGAEVVPRLLGDADYAAMLVRDVDMVVPGNALKWGPLERRRRFLDFSEADLVADFARVHGMAMRGHTLLWHNQIPKWLPGRLANPKKSPARTIEKHIHEVVGRYRGRMHSWDVINEAIEPKDGRADGLRKSLFLDALGPDYIDRAFRAAAQADPDALLVFNEYGHEWGWDVGRQRRRATLRLLEKLLGKGVPVHALGLQGHLAPGMMGAMDMLALGRFCDEVADLGLSIQVTELDARDTSIVGSIQARDRIVADAYTRFLDVVLARAATKLVLTWGITDRHSWLTSHFPRPDGDTVRGLPYDANFKRKPAWYALAAALDAAPVRDAG
ncbi:MAG: glycosyl hydrolase family 10 [Rhodospirillales bacterium]|jgi:endo-1,4-beta-xylanase|nr:glycosyl hydrolase family 10 [Rhodospirillales bacterium]